MEDASEPLIFLVDGKEFIASPENTTLTTFLGRTALENGLEVDNSRYNHVFIELSRDEKRREGIFIFQGDELYEPMFTHLAENDYPMYLNRREVHDSERTAYDNSIADYIKDTVSNLADMPPDEWRHEP